MSNASLIKIKAILKTLLEQAIFIDEQNAKNKSFSLRKDNPIFSEDLFATNSDKISHYIHEIQLKTDELSHLMTLHKEQFSFARLALIEQQTSAIINAINANQSLNKASDQRLIAIRSKKYRKAAQSIMQTTQALHQKLAETHEFERRLQEMLNDKQGDLARVTNAKKDKVTNDLLVLHQRLGRCRQAISKIERQIEMTEKR